MPADLAIGYSEAMPIAGSARPEDSLVRVENGRVSGPAHAFFGHLLDGDRGNSIFAEWKAQRGSLTLECDKLGMWPLYYATGPGFAAASPSVPSLLRAGAPAGLDLDALSVFVRLGFFLGDDTAFRNVRALPPGGSVSWTAAGGLRVHSQPVPSNEAGLTRRAAQAAYVDLVRQAVARRTRSGTFLLPLSGGRDSRHILFELHRQKSLPRFCFTTRFYGDRAEDDIKLAPLVARVVGVPWRLVRPWRLQLRAEIQKNETTGFCSDEHAWALGLADFLGKQGISSVFDGIGGDALSTCPMQTEELLALYRAGKLDELAAKILRENSLGEDWLKLALHPDFHKELSFERACERLKRELARHDGRPSPMAAFYFSNRTRREIALYTFRVLPESVVPLCPYLDRDLVELMLAVPGEYIVDKRFHDECLADAFPEFSDIPLEDKTRPPSGRGIYWRSLYASHGLYSLANLKHSGFVDQRALWPRIMRGLVTGNSGRARLLRARGSAMLVYLTQLNATVHGFEARAS